MVVKRYRELKVELTGVAPGVVLPIDHENELITNTTAILSGGGTFTSANQDVKDYAFISLTLFADQNGALYVEFTSDGTNYDVSRRITYFRNRPYSYGPVRPPAPTMRLRYVNGAVAQGAFRLYLYGKK
jgi:hypothetical protein